MKQSGTIIVKLQGGIGNQLFQWAYYKAAKEYHNIESFIDLNFYNDQTGVTPREFQLNQFPSIQYDVFSITEFTGTTNASMAAHITASTYCSFSLTYHV